MTTVTDDLGHEMSASRPTNRLVSLVPSITEAIATTRRQSLVAATDWCTYPADLDVERIRGTKNPNIRRIIQLAPDLVIANQEENRRLDVERLRQAGIAVWVTVTEDVPGAVDALSRLFTDALGWGEPSWLTECRESWSGPAPAPRLRVAVPIWRDPWMVVGARTFAGDVLARVGLQNVFGDGPGRYPKVTLAEIDQYEPDLVLLPDEPYRFHSGDGPEAFPNRRTVLVEGRALSWYGPSLLTARRTIVDALAP